ncbi:MAG: hypothetical protein PHI12_01385 [Dehalococcoidales bacterium]|nr:hypothetical protein [Dehalococcoidales bacterium]
MTRKLLLLSLTIAITAGMLASGTFALFHNTEKSTDNLLTAWIETVSHDYTWTVTDWSDFFSGAGQYTRVNLEYPEQPENYDAYVYLTEDVDFYAFRGNNTPDFWRYNEKEDMWYSATAAPAAIGAGGSLSYTKDQYIYGMRGNNTTDFWRYDITNHTWAVMAATPDVVNAGGYLRYGGDGKIYAYQGGTTAFWVYDTDTDAWSTLAPTSGSTGAGASLVWTGGNDIYGTLGGGSASFWRYSISGNSWTAMTGDDYPTGGIGAGAELSYVNVEFVVAGTTYSFNHIYATRGGGSTDFYRYSLDTGTWEVRDSTPAAITSGGTLRWDGKGFMFAFRGGNSDDVWRYNILRDAWPSALAPTAYDITNGGAICIDGNAEYLYALQGDNDKFWRYHIPLDFTWEEMESAPGTVSSGGALACTGAYIYALQGNSSTGFWQYDVAANSWTAMAPTPANVTAGGALAWDGGNYLYAFQGGSTAFWCYDISGNSWTTMTSAPGSIGYGGALGYRSENKSVYALRGGNTTYFYRFDTTTGTWINISAIAQKTRVPGAVGAGGALACPPGNYLYIMRGNNTQSFYLFDMNDYGPGEEGWFHPGSTNLDATPDNVGTGGVGGGALVFDGFSFIYGLRGTNSMDFWRYSIPNDSWETTAEDLPDSADAGAKMVGYVKAYATEGWRLSAVFDSGANDTDWLVLEWDETLPTNTDIDFEVRASNTEFYLNDTTPAWIAVGGNSPANLSLTGRYVQWRVTLSTGNIMVTPELYEVRMLYSTP